MAMPIAFLLLPSLNSLFEDYLINRNRSELREMARQIYIAPTPNAGAFHCPLCGVYADQTWRNILWAVPALTNIAYWRTATCSHCQQSSFWRDGAMIFPATGTAELPSDDLPDDMRADYEEAREIVQRSARGAAALLRLVIQKLCKHLGERGENPNDDIANLVKKGLPAGVQKAFDTVRVTGNESVHPGQIDLRDNPEMAASLFGLVNFIVEKMITEPKEIDALYAALPEEKKVAIAKRDGNI